MKTTTITPVLSLITAGIYASSGYASEFNTAFLQGTSEIPSILKDGVRYPAGHYYADVSLNGNKTGRFPLGVSAEDEKNDQLCLSPEWLQSAGIYFRADAYHETFDSARGCYQPGQKSGTEVNFNLANQTLDFVIPQAWLADKSDVTRWDYGINGLRLSYSGNFSKNVQNRHNGYSDDSLNAYGNINSSLNLGRWVLSADMNASRNAQNSEFDTNNLVLSTAIHQVRGDLQIGRSQTRTELFQDFGFYGAALSSNSNMRPWSARGYAPVITGVASSTSRITITQGGYTVYSRVIPAGPYRLEDISPVSNGNLLVTVEDNNGQKTVTEYPVATLPTLLRAGEFNYNLAVGERSDSNKVRDAFRAGTGVFTLASLDYGFSTTTLNSALLLHNQYQAAGLGFTQSLGAWGAFSASLNASKAAYDNEDDRKGVSATFKYAKSFTSRTDLQILTYRYQSPGYTEFSAWQPDVRLRYPGYRFGDEDHSYNYVSFSGREKARYEARLSHRFDGLYLSASWWQQSYWDHNRHGTGASMSASTSVGNGISVFLSGNYSRNAWSSRDDLSGSLSISIPFSAGGVRHYGSGSVSSSSNGTSSFNTSASATLSERFNYSVSAGTDSHRNYSAGVSGSYAFDSIQTNMAVSKSRDTTTLSGSASGSVIATSETGLILTKQTSDTIAVVKLKDIPGITFNGSMPTNSRGNTVLYLTGYNPTTISINPENLPDNAELLNTSFEVVPTEKAIIYREFGFQNVKRYILRLRDMTGQVLTGGSAVTEQGINAGFISNNGVLLMNLLAAPKRISVTRSNGSHCSFDAEKIQENTGKVQEVRCE
ncbi:PefC/AfrB family outer membrane usher protein [Salmonella enterica]|nr:PefC/AfrB family outer membrane usher protein [Salmonella enterica]